MIRDGVKVPHDDVLESVGVFLADLDKFRVAARKVMREWRCSCEQFLLNENINRVAWLGQSAACISEGIPSRYKAGFYTMSLPQQALANDLAGALLKEWLDDFDDGKWDSRESGEVHTRLDGQGVFRWNS
jgi:hypothetical protein